MAAASVTSSRTRALVWSMLGAGTVTTLAALPPFLLSAQSVLMRRDLDFDERQLGLAVSAFFATAAVTALLLGRVVDRAGPRRAVVLGGLLATASATGVAVGTSLVAQPYVLLLVCMAVAGTVNATLQVTANLSVASSLPPDLQGTGYGIKQSAIPFSILIGGLAVPAVAVTAGWQWTWAAAAVGGLAVAAWGWSRLPTHAPAVARGADRELRGAPGRALVVTFLSMSVASAAVNSLGAFLPAWAFESGLSPGAAGLLLGAGSAASIAVRVLSGRSADRRGGRHLPVVARDLVIGAVGLLLVATGTLPLLVVGAMAAFAFGWGWPGLLMFAVVRMGRDRPGAASTAVQAGAFVGGATGPVSFGLLVSWAGFQVAWSVAAVALLVAAAGLLVARRLFRADLLARP